MCGRFALTATPDQTETFIGAEVEAFPARYNIAPTQPILMVVAGEPRPPGSNLPDRRSLLVRWGLIPGWVKDTRQFPLLFNARSEAAAEKASFRAAMRHRRALVPASGFYEWRKAAGGRGQPYWVRPRQGGMIAFAGLMEPYLEPGGAEMDTGAILTANANEDIAHIHERMPVAIEPKDFSRWLDCRRQEPRDVADLLRPPAPGFWEAIPVSELVNKVTNVGPEIQERAEPGTMMAAPPKAKISKSTDDGQMTLF